jgi:hypothetical protein
MMCECCWSDMQRQQIGRGVRIDYEAVLARHQEIKCICTDFESMEGARRRAGQFWDEERQIDVREPSAPEAQEPRP